MIKPKVDFTRYADEVEALKKRDEPKGEIVFCGSSTFTFWGHGKLKEDMSPITAVNRGFGGSTAHDALHYYEQLIPPLRPKILVWYEGDNDLACGYTPEEILEITSALFGKTRADFLGVRFLAVSVKQSPSRKELWEKIAEYNELMLRYVSENNDMAIMDMKKVTHDNMGNAREDIYLEDGLHFNEKGYLLLAGSLKEVLLKLA